MTACLRIIAPDTVCDGVIETRSVPSGLRPHSDCRTIAITRKEWLVPAGPQTDSGTSEAVLSGHRSEESPCDGIGEYAAGLTIPD